MPYQYKREPLTHEEMNRLLHAAKTHEEKLVLWTLLETGLRVSELATLKQDQIDWQTRPVRLTIHGKGGPYGSKTKVRIVPVKNEGVVALLQRHFAVKDELAMSSRTIQRLVKDLAKRAGIRRLVTPHVLRHTFSVTAVQKGISLPALQRMLGHSRLTTTEVYLNLSPQHVIDEFQAKW